MTSTFSFLKGNVLVLTVCRIIWTMSNSLAFPYFSLYVIALGGSATEIGLIAAIGGAAGLILYPMGGFIADQRGRVRLVGFSTYMFALSFGFFASAWSWQILGVGRFFQQLVLFYIPAMNAIMADSLPPGKRGIGFATTMAIPGAIGVIMPYIGGYLIDNVYGGDIIPAMQLSYMISLSLGLIVATIRVKFLQETHTGDDLGYPMWNLPRLLKDSYSATIETLKWLPKSLRIIGLIQVLTVFFVSIANPFWIVYAKQVIGLTALEWGELTLLAGGFRILISIPLGQLIDRYGSKKILVVTAPLAPIATGLFPFCKGFLHVLGVLLLVEVFNTVVMPATSTLMADFVPRERRGRVLSILGQGAIVGWGRRGMGAFLLFIPITIGSLVSGYIYDFNAVYPWYILTAALVICFVLIVKFIEEPKQRQK